MMKKWKGKKGGFMKKKSFMVICIIVALILLFPIPFRLKDGGSIEFKALLYTITKYHKLAPIEDADNGYIEGIGIEILGMEIYNSANDKDNKIDEQNNTTEEYSFYATVIEAKEMYMLVEPVEGSQELKSSDKISIGLEENNDEVYSVGMIVKITYDGTIMETYPAKINVIRIEIQ